RVKALFPEVVGQAGQNLVIHAWTNPVDTLKRRWDGKSLRFFTLFTGPLDPGAPEASARVFASLPAPDGC
ncbi:MAG: hypothetical protein AAB403_09745, partial [Planctomycetota bacterium]